MKLLKNSGKKSLKISEAFKILNKKLSFYETKEIISFLTGKKYPDFIFDNSYLDTEKIEFFIKKRLEDKLPIQYLLKRVEFYGRYFYIEEGVFIPREETEILVKKAIDVIRERKIKKFLEIGVGSGCITGTILSELENVEAVVTDISHKAIEVSRKNFKRLGVSERVEIRKEDIYEADEKFSLVISNPPYISYKEKEELQEEVKKEPEEALFSGKSGMEFLERILRNQKKFFEKNAFFLFEIGYNQKDKVLEFLEKNNFELVEVLKDFNNIERVVFSKCRF